MFTIPCAVAQNIQTLLVARFFAGFSGSAFLSVAGGTVADLFAPTQVALPMMVYTAAPFTGPVIGPVVGGFINQYTNWQWTFYILLIWNGVMLGSIVLVPETYHPILLARKASAVRKVTKNSAYHSALELTRASKTLTEALLQSLYRPFQLLFLDPMCLCLCTYCSLLLGILYLFFEAFVSTTSSLKFLFSTLGFCRKCLSLYTLVSWEVQTCHTFAPLRKNENY
jgi:MFS family permease